MEVAAFVVLGFLALFILKSFFFCQQMTLDNIDRFHRRIFTSTTCTFFTLHQILVQGFFFFGDLLFYFVIL